MAVSKIKCDLAPTEEVTKSVYLNLLTWTQSSDGMWYALVDTFQKKIISAYILDFAKLRATDVINVFCPNSYRCCLFANTGTFAQGSSIVIELFLRG